MIEATNLSLIPDIRHGFFTRIGGFSSGAYKALNCSTGSDDDPALVARNREIVATSLGLRPHELVSPHQCHGKTVVTVREPWERQNAPQADGLVTDAMPIAIAVTTADCVPVLFADRDRPVIGVAHAGWRGALAGIIDAVLTAMESLGARRETIFAAVGPAISGAAYEVGPELRAAFIEDDETSTRFFTPARREGHVVFDLPRYVVAKLLGGGVRSVEHIDRCTYTREDEFFSHRRSTHRGERRHGGQMSAITLGPNVFIETA